jgi:hypothetical protein
MRLRKIWIDMQRSPVFRDRALQIASGSQGIAKSDVFLGRAHLGQNSLSLTVATVPCGGNGGAA